MGAEVPTTPGWGVNTTTQNTPHTTAMETEVPGSEFSTHTCARSVGSAMRPGFDLDDEEEAEEIMEEQVCAYVGCVET